MPEPTVALIGFKEALYGLAGALVGLLGWNLKRARADIDDLKETKIGREEFDGTIARTTRESREAIDRMETTITRAAETMERASSAATERGNKIREHIHAVEKTVIQLEARIKQGD